MAGARRLDREGVQAILNLVAAAVPGLRPQNIAIVDSRGDLLARAGEPVGPAAPRPPPRRRSTPPSCASPARSRKCWSARLGPGRVRAEATVRMNFDQVNETQERYDPDGQVTRSTQTVTDNSKTTEASAGRHGAEQPAERRRRQQPAPARRRQRQEETTNYEISKTVRTLVREQPQIARISLAVMVDGSGGRAAPTASRTGSRASPRSWSASPPW